MLNIAVLLTVYNRKEVTLQGLHTLNQAINRLGDDYAFEIYMTDDGCTDGTGEAVNNQFPDVIIIKGDGSLFWSGGMRYAWQKALASNKPYDYYLWFNDDVNLYVDALETLFADNHAKGGDVIITGAMCDRNGHVSYGGRNKKMLMEPTGAPEPIELMNGNLVLIPSKVVCKIGIIDEHYRHGEGDFDYGCRSKQAGFGVFLSSKYVGVVDRHDEIIPRYCSEDYNFSERWKILHAPYTSLKDHYRFNYKYRGKLTAIITLFASYIGVFSPFLYKKMRKMKTK